MAPRNRLLYALLSLLTSGLGLASRRFETGLPGWVGAYAGDALWALLVFWLVGWCFSRQPLVWVAGVAATLALSIELSQLYHAPWLDGLRATTPGHLVLGQGFLWSDLLCYAVGILAGAGLEQLWLPRNSRPACSR